MLVDSYDLILLTKPALLVSIVVAAVTLASPIKIGINSLHFTWRPLVDGNREVSGG